jgi:hypothetical protein
MSYINIEFEIRTSLEQLLESLCHVDGFSVQGNLLDVHIRAARDAGLPIDSVAIQSVRAHVERVGVAFRVFLELPEGIMYKGQLVPHGINLGCPQIDTLPSSQRLDELCSAISSHADIVKIESY